MNDNDKKTLDLIDKASIELNRFFTEIKKLNKELEPLEENSHAKWIIRKLIKESKDALIDIALPKALIQRHPSGQN